MDQDPESLVARAEALVRSRWKVLDDHIAGPTLAASGASGGDLMITMMASWRDAAWRAAEVPRVEAIYQEVVARPALAAVWERHIRP